MVGPEKVGRRPQTDNPPLPFLHGVRNAVVKDRRREEITEGLGMQYRLHEPRRWRQQRLKKERISGRIFRKTAQLEIEKRIIGSSAELRKVSDWASWRGRPLRNQRRDVKSTGFSGTLEQSWWWYTSTGSNLIGEPLGTTDLIEGAEGAVRK
jgi:hypothetical protein